MLGGKIKNALTPVAEEAIAWSGASVSHSGMVEFPRLQAKHDVR